MTYRPAQRLADISPFHVVELLTRARQLEAEGRDIIHMEVGEPDFPTPAPIANAAVDAIKSGKTLYTQSLGLPELREAISAFYRSTLWRRPCRPTALPSPTALPAPSTWPSPAWPIRAANGCWPTPATPATATFCGFTRVDRDISRSGRKATSSRHRRNCVSTGTPQTAGLLRRLAGQSDRHAADPAGNRRAGRGLPRERAAISWSTRSTTA